MSRDWAELHPTSVSLAKSTIFSHQLPVVVSRRTETNLGVSGPWRFGASAVYSHFRFPRGPTRNSCRMGAVCRKISRRGGRYQARGYTHMLQTWLALLPRDATMTTVIVSVIIALAGAGLWLAGGKYARQIVTVTCVALGTFVGINLPQWCGWSIDGMGPAIAGALLLGIAGYALTRWCIGVGMGLCLACWACAAVWTLQGGVHGWKWPNISWTNLPQWTAAVWRQVPDDASRWFPYAAVAAIAIGLLAVRYWPRQASAVAWSMGGLTMLLAMGLASMKFSAPKALTFLPRDAWAQAAILGLLLLAGTYSQWRLMPGGSSKPASGSKKAKSE